MNAAAFVAGLDLTLKLDPKRSQEDAMSELIQLGLKGSAEACYWRGRWEELRGEFVQAFQSYTCGAVKNHHESLLARGDLYEKGRVPMATNPQMDAWNDYGMAAEAGSARAWVLLGQMRETGSVTGHQDVPGAWAFYSVALRKLPPGEKVFREFAQGRVAAAERVLNPFGAKVAREAAEAGLRGGPKALVARELDLLEASAKQRDDDKLAAERDAAARRPTCQPSTDAAVECEGPRVR